jgi:hypothetical protein
MSLVGAAFQPRRSRLKASPTNAKDIAAGKPLPPNTKHQNTHLPKLLGKSEAQNPKSETKPKHPNTKTPKHPTPNT